MVKVVLVMLDMVTFLVVEVVSMMVRVTLSW